MINSKIAKVLISVIAVIVACLICLYMGYFFAKDLFVSVILAYVFIKLLVIGSPGIILGFIVLSIYFRSCKEPYLTSLIFTGCWKVFVSVVLLLFFDLSNAMLPFDKQYFLCFIFLSLAFIISILESLYLSFQFGKPMRQIFPLSMIASGMYLASVYYFDRFIPESKF